MSFIKKLRKMTWIDWVKTVVAIDIASVGIGLIIGLRFHVLAYVFGFISRIAFGAMYIFVAVLIFKRVFPDTIIADHGDDAKEENLDTDIATGISNGKKYTRQLISEIKKYTEKLLDLVDALLDRGEDFFKKRISEARTETKKIIDKK